MIPAPIGLGRNVIFRNSLVQRTDANRGGGRKVISTYSKLIVQLNRHAELVEASLTLR